MESEAIEFETSDGVRLQGDLRMPDDPLGAAIVCHPHPQHGGNRRNAVVESLFAALPAAGIAALRFDFRPAFGGGQGERLDAEAALLELRRRSPGTPTFATGYSFGAMIALALDDERLSAKVLVAPPLGHMPVAPAAPMPTFVLTPAHDQFTPPEVARPIVDTWPEAEYQTIESVDHFLVGRAVLVAERATEWLISDRWRRRSLP